MLIRFVWVIGAWLVLKRSGDRATRRLSSNQQGELLRRLASDGSLSWPLRLAARVPWLYRRSPIDLLPDFLPVIGRLDDRVVTSAALRLLTRLTPKQAMARHLADLQHG